LPRLISSTPRKYAAVAISPAAPRPGASRATAAAIARASASRPLSARVSSVCAPVGGTRPGLPVSSASSCASAETCDRRQTGVCPGASIFAGQALLSLVNVLVWPKI
jgi:hypothetical protein